MPLSLVILPTNPTTRAVLGIPRDERVFAPFRNLGLSGLNRLIASTPLLLPLAMTKIFSRSHKPSATAMFATDQLLLNTLWARRHDIRSVNLSRNSVSPRWPVNLSPRM